MVSFHEVRFPTSISYGATGGPEFNTSITSLFSGFEQRNINWTLSRGQWDISTGIKNRTDITQVISFFRARYGRAYGFRFKDWTDYSVTGQNIGTGDGVKTVFQLKKTYNDGSYTFDRTIKKPVNNSAMKVYKNGVLQTSGVTIDYTSGTVTFSSAPANTVAVTADFEFDVPVRFDTDLLSINIKSFEQFVGDSISLVEIKV